MRVAIYRNLNAAKARPDVHIFSVAALKSARSLGKVFKDANGKTLQTQTAILKDVEAICNAKTLRRMATAGENNARSVAAWITGDMVPSLGGRRVAISLNPKNGETEFRYRAPGRAVVNWAHIAGVEFSAVGMFGILKGGN